jgi:hypothetical protein
MAVKYEVVKKGREWGLKCLASGLIIAYNKKRKPLQDRADKLNKE